MSRERGKDEKNQNLKEVLVQTVDKSRNRKPIDHKVGGLACCVGIDCQFRSFTSV